MLGCAAAAFAVLLQTRPAEAASGTWNGTTDGNWNSTTNWSVNPAPGSTTVINSADVATFNNAGNGNTTITIDANRNIKSISFDTSTASYTIGSVGANGGNPLILTSGGAVALAATVAGTNLIETFNAPLTLEGNYAFTDARADAGSALLFAGNITNAAASTLTLSGAGSGTGNLISGNIADGAGAQSVTLTATAGVWTLGGANAYSGTTTVNGTGGTLVLSGTNSSANATTVANGTLRLTNTAALANSALTLGGGTLQLRSDNAGDTFAAASTAISASTTISADSLASGSNNTIKLGAVNVTASTTATLTVSAGNGYGLGLGAVTQTALAGTTFTVSNSASLTMASYATNSNAAAPKLSIGGAGTTTVTGNITQSGSGTLSLEYTGTGTLTLSGTGGYSGTTNVGTSNGANAGTLKLSGSGTMGSGAVTVFGGTLDINGLTRTLGGALTLGGGATGSSATLSIGATGVLNLGGGVTFTANNNPNGATISGGTLNLVAPRTFTIGDSTNVVADMTITATIGDGNGIFDITKAGSGTLAYTQAINLGALPSATPTANVTAGTLDLDGVVTGGNGIFSVVKAGAGTLNYAPNMALTSNQTATVASSAGTLQFSGVISGSGVGLTAAVTGTGAVMLTGANTYTGATSVTGTGTLKLSGADGCVASSNVTVSSGGTLNFDSSSLGMMGTTRAQGVALIGNSSTGTSLTVTGNAGVSSVDSIAGALTGGAGLGIVTITPNAAQNARLNAGSFAHSTGSLILFRGTGLGANSIVSATAGSANISFTTAPALSGSGAAGSTTVGVLQGTYGDITTSGTGSGLVTYDATRGIRLLDTTSEYTAVISDGQAQLDNVRFVRASGGASQDINLTQTTTTINSLSFKITGAGTNSGVTISGDAGTSLKLNSGMIFASQTVTTAASTDAMTISVPKLDLNAQGGTFIVFSNGLNNGNTAAPLQINSEITNDGGNGVTIGGSGEVIFGGSVANTYTGVTTVNSGILRLAKGVINGAIAGDLVMNGGVVLESNNAIADTASVTINGGTLYFDTTTSSGNNGHAETVNNFAMNGGAVANHGSNAAFTINGDATLNASQLAMNQGGDITVLGTTTLSGGQLVARESSSTTSFTGLTALNNVRIVNTVSGSYTAVLLDSNATNKGALLTIKGDVSFTGNATNANTALIDTSDNTLANQGVIALNGTRIFNIGDGAAATDLSIIPALTDNAAVVGGVTKTGNGALKLTGANTYTGPTSVNGGTLEISGSISGSATAPVNVTSGKLVLSASNAVSNTAMALTLGDAGNSTSGTLKLSDSLSGASETFGVLNVSFNATIDFGALAGNSLIFAGVGDHTLGSSTLSIQNWSGTALQSGNASTDRLIFSGNVASFTNIYSQQDVSFNGVFGYQAIGLGAGQFEVVAVPEPTPLTLNLAAGLVGLLGFRRWRRLAGR